VTSFDDLDAFLRRYTPFEQAVRAHSEEVRWIPYVETTFIDKLPFILPWWYITCNHKVENIHVSRVRFRDLEEHVILQ
jgi:hypothetical protein